MFYLSSKYGNYAKVQSILKDITNRARIIQRYPRCFSTKQKICPYNEYLLWTKPRDKKYKYNLIVSNNIIKNKKIK